MMLNLALSESWKITFRFSLNGNYTVEMVRTYRWNNTAERDRNSSRSLQATRCIPMSHNKSVYHVRTRVVTWEPTRSIVARVKVGRVFNWVTIKFVHGESVNETLNDNRHSWLRYFAGKLYGITKRRTYKVLKRDIIRGKPCSILVAIV